MYARVLRDTFSKNKTYCKSHSDFIYLCALEESTFCVSMCVVLCWGSQLNVSHDIRILMNYSKFTGEECAINIISFNNVYGNNKAL